MLSVSCALVCCLFVFVLRSTCKPVELYHLIERYCVGRRRLELFGSEHNIRHGWLTLGSSIPPELENFDMDKYVSLFEVEPINEHEHEHEPGLSGSPPPQYVTRRPPPAAAIAAQRARDAYDRAEGRFDARLSHYLPHSRELEHVRPKSPPLKFAQRGGGGGGGRRYRQSQRRVWNDGRTAGMRELQAYMARRKQPQLQQEAATSSHSSSTGVNVPASDGFSPRGVAPSFQSPSASTFSTPSPSNAFLLRSSSISPPPLSSFSHQPPPAVQRITPQAAAAHQQQQQQQSPYQPQRPQPQPPQRPQRSLSPQPLYTDAW